MEFSINEINIVCTDKEASLHFYSEILGFTVVSEEEGCWHLLCGNTPFLLLPLAGERAQQKEYCSVATISVDLVVEDLDRAASYLTGKGVQILKTPAPNANRFFIQDPDGLVFEVLSSTRSGT